MNRNIIHNVLFRMFIPIPYGALIYLLLLAVNNNLLVLNDSFLSAELFFCIALSYLTFETNRLALVKIFHNAKMAAMANILQVMVNTGITLILIYLGLTIYFVYFLGYSSIAGFGTEIRFFSLFFGITSILYTILSISYTLLNQRNDRLISEEETLKDQVQYELDHYQAEMNPELLFESLESAIDLIDKDIIKAEEFIDELALVYRYMLSTRDMEVVQVTDEFQAAQKLVALHNVKHNGLINLDSEIKKEQLLVVPGSLPILIDEIIKSNIITEMRPLNIVLGMEDNYLTLSYKLNERLIKNNHEEMTIKRLQSAYSYLSDQPLVKVQAYGESFYKIPLLNEIAA
jgi:two-component system LytT family sensor kinase